MCCTSIHVWLYIQLFLSQSFNPLPAHAILDEVFFICLQDLMGRPTQSLTACVNSGGTKSEKQFFLNEGFWSTESLCMTLFFSKELHEQNKFSGRFRVKHAVYLMRSEHTVTCFHTQIKDVPPQKVKATV